MAQRRRVIGDDKSIFDGAIEKIFRVEHEWHAWDSCCVDNSFVHECETTGQECKGERIAVQFKQVRGFAKKPIRPVFALTRYREVDKKGKISWRFFGSFRGLNDIPNRKVIRVLEKCNMLFNEFTIHLPQAARNTDEWMMTMRAQNWTREMPLPGYYADLWETLMLNYVRKIATKTQIPKGWTAETTKSGGRLIRKIFYSVDSIEFVEKILRGHAGNWRMIFKFDNDLNTLGVSLQDQKTNGITLEVVARAKIMNQEAADARRIYKLKNDSKV